ncbi:MAG: SDR family oxidoreductase [Pedobacter sp.]|nr:SDR family oxidoreductase [Pedobacter sp.]
MTEKENIVITGVSGFLGTYLSKLCLEKGYNVVGIDRNPVKIGCTLSSYIQSPIDDVDWDVILKKYRPKFFFHLAASASVGASISDPIGDFSRVLPSTARLLYALAKLKTNVKFIYFSSAAVYGNPSTLPISESAEVRPISPYGVHKHVAEQLIYSMGSCYGLNTICLRIFSAFGIGLKKQLFFDLNKKINEAKRTGIKTIHLYGTGRESRDFIHGHDVAVAALLVAEKEQSVCHRVLNVGSGSETTIKYAVDTYLTASGYQFNVKFDGQERVGDPKNWRSNIDLLEKYGFVLSKNFDEELLAYSKWVSVLNK